MKYYLSVLKKILIPLPFFLQKNKNFPNLRGFEKHKNFRFFLFQTIYEKKSIAFVSVKMIIWVFFITGELLLIVNF
jgi:hypothetical protein